MEKIINALVLSPEQKEAFLAAAPGVEQVFLRDSDITAADLEGATVLLATRRLLLYGKAALPCAGCTPAAPALISICPKASCLQVPCSPRRWAHTASRFRSTCSPC